MNWFCRGLSGVALALVGCPGGDDGSGSGFMTVPMTSTMPPATSDISTSAPTTGGSTGATGTSGEVDSEASSQPTTGTSSSSSEATTGASSTGGPACGDGVVDDGEGCDDGNFSDNDACTNACAPAACGDGVVQEGVEGCDDGNDVDGDACTNACATADCGDGVVQDGEEVCDDGNDDDTDACTSMCQAATCGDGFVQAGVEQCDAVVETALCDADCTDAACGDGAVNASAGEKCDDGNQDDADACVACKAAKCGDGFVHMGVEQCDDGNVANGDGCENNCTPTQLPPECLSAAPLDDATRSVNYVNQSVACDSMLTTQWYRFVGASGTGMPTSAPPVKACGTDAPGWLNGSLPSFGQGAVDRTVCFHWNNNTCNWQEPAKVLNCNGYYVYYLKNIAWGCSGRYCGAP